MMQAGYRKQNAAFFSTMLLVVAILFAQWVGVIHRVVHGGGLQRGAIAAESTTVPLLPDWINLSSHSCAELDAATLGDAMSSTVFITPILPDSVEVAQQVAFSSWTVPLLCHFSSRAPPQS